MSFLYEGAGYHNVLGYFVYALNPIDVNDPLRRYHNSNQCGL